MNKHSMLFIGLDRHKEFHEVAMRSSPCVFVPVCVAQDIKHLLAAMRLVTSHYT